VSGLAELVDLIATAIIVTADRAGSGRSVAWNDAEAAAIRVVALSGVRPSPQPGLDVERLARAMWNALSDVYDGGREVRIFADDGKELSNVAGAVAAEYDRLVSDDPAVAARHR
jgi:hypothetical protein